jgi:DNA-binding transcriptional ArsR family regulator
MATAHEDPLSEYLRALAHPYRRVVLYYLREHERATLDALGDCLAGWMGAGPETGSSADPETIRVALHHVHVPKLADAGLLTYDPETQRATLEPLSPTVDRFVSTALDADTGAESVDHLLARRDD